MDLLDGRYSEYTAAAGRENRDRVSFQLDQVDRQEAREIQRLQELIDTRPIARRCGTVSPMRRS